MYMHLQLCTLWWMYMHTRHTLNPPSNKKSNCCCMMCFHICFLNIYTIYKFHSIFYMENSLVCFLFTHLWNAYFVQPSPYSSTQCNGLVCISCCLICESIRSSHGPAIWCSNSVIMLFLCFATRLLSVFFKHMLGLTILPSFICCRTVLTVISWVVNF